jgi:L-lactate utilization protein LutB
VLGEEAVMPEEIKVKSARTTAEVVHSPTEAESKDLLESDRLKMIKNLDAYQDKTKEKAFDIWDSVLLRSPQTESLAKLEPKWDRPYLIPKKIKAKIL